MAPLLLAEVNERMPRTHGHSAFPFSRVAAFTATRRELPSHAPQPETEVEARIGELIADLVDDRACLQLGIGGIPDAVLSRLHNKHDLGIHTEMFSDGVVALAEAGVITNRFKSIHAGRIITSFAVGSRRLCDFIRGVALSRGGKPIIALRSTAAGGSISRIVPELNPGAGVVTTRGPLRMLPQPHRLAHPDGNPLPLINGREGTAQSR